MSRDNSRSTAPKIKDPTRKATLKAALEYADNGLAVIPMFFKKDGKGKVIKQPLIKAWQKRASTNPDAIKRWWSRWPDLQLGIGIPCMMNNIVGVDVDGEEAYETLARLEAEHGRLPRNWTVQASRGEHFYMQAGDHIRTSSGKLGPGIDVRAETNGFLVAPPSVNQFTGHTYTWKSRKGTLKKVPRGWIKPLLDAKPPPVARDDFRVVPIDVEPEFYVRTAWREHTENLDLTWDGSHSRDDTLVDGVANMAKYEPGGYVTEDQIWKTFATIAKAKNLGPAQIKSTINSGITRGQADPVFLKVKKWPDPESLIPSLGGPPLDRLPAAFREYVAALAKETSTPADLALFNSLGVLSQATQGAWKVRVKASWEAQPLCLYLCSLSPSGTRKSTAQARAQEPMLDYERQRLGEWEATYADTHSAHELAVARVKEAQRAAQKSEDPELEDAYVRLVKEAERLDPGKPPIFFTSDATAEAFFIKAAENKGLLYVSASEGTFLANISGRYSGQPTTESFNEAYDGNRVIRDRIARSNTARSGIDSYVIDHPYWVLNLSVQPDIVAGLSVKAMRDNGFYGRFLWAYPPSNLGKRDFTQEKRISREIEASWHEGVYALARKAGDVLVADKKPRTLHCTRELRVEVERFIQQLEPRLSLVNGDLGDLPEWGSKQPARLVRIAALLELFKDPNAEKGLFTVEGVRSVTSTRAAVVGASRAG